MHKSLITKGAIICNQDEGVYLPDGSHVPNVPTGAQLIEHVDKYYANIKPSQAYYGVFEEMEDKMCGTLSWEPVGPGKEMEEHEQKLAKLEKKFELKKRKNFNGKATETQSKDIRKGECTFILT